MAIQKEPEKGVFHECVFAIIPGQELTDRIYDAVGSALTSLQSRRY